MIIETMPVTKKRTECSPKTEYLFIKIGESKEITTKYSNDMDEFKSFCHYCTDMTWEQIKPVITKCLALIPAYALDGNSILYYIIQFPKR